MLEESGTNPPEAEDEAVARLRQVTKTYDTGAVEVPALKGVSLDIPARRFSTDASGFCG